MEVCTQIGPISRKGFFKIICGANGHLSLQKIKPLKKNQVGIHKTPLIFGGLCVQYHLW
jgi:hypothetical protein